MTRRIFLLHWVAICFSLFNYSLGVSVGAQVAQRAPNPSDKGTPVTLKKDRCTVSGTVVSLASGEPLGKTRVQLVNADDRTRSTTVTTDSGGHFELKRVEPARYRLEVRRVAYVTQRYGQRKANDPGAILALRPGQEMNDLVFKMISAAVISGKIVDEDGEVLPGVTVSAMREVYYEGRRTLMSEYGDGMSRSNDLGEYRLFGLAPGRYFVSASYSGMERRADEDAQNAPGGGYARMYYPGTADRGTATAIVVKAGEEVPSLEIMMRQVQVYHVRGHVYNQITNRPGREVFVFAMPRDKSHEFGDNISRVEKADGSFDVEDVLPGPYVLGSVWMDQGKTYTTRVPVDVGNADVDGISLTIAPGSNVRGRVAWDGNPSLDGDDLRINLSPTDSTLGLSQDARVNADGSFTLLEIGDGSYEVVVAGQSKDCYLKDVEYAGSSALEDGFTTRRGSAATLEITLSSRGARVQGGVTEADRLPATGVWVALVPDSEVRRGKHRLYKSQTTDQYGHFDLRGIAPGDYLVFSWTDIDDGAWEDPEFMKPFLENNQGEKLSVQEGDAKTLNLVTIKRASTEQQKP